MLILEVILRSCWSSFCCLAAVIFLSWFSIAFLDDEKWKKRSCDPRPGVKEHTFVGRTPRELKLDQREKLKRQNDNPKIVFIINLLILVIQSVGLTRRWVGELQQQVVVVLVAVVVVLVVITTTSCCCSCCCCCCSCCYYNNKLLLFSYNTQVCIHIHTFSREGWHWLQHRNDIHRCTSPQGSPQPVNSPTGRWLHFFFIEARVGDFISFVLWGAMKYHEVLWSTMRYYEVLWSTTSQRTNTEAGTVTIQCKFACLKCKKSCGCDTQWDR